MYKLTDGKGFSIVLLNNWEVSVQWGPGNYCDNRWNLSNPFEKSTPEYGQWVSKTAEIRALDVNGKPWEFPGRGNGCDSEEVLGYCTVEQVLEFISAISELTTSTVHMDFPEIQAKSFKAMEAWNRKWFGSVPPSGSVLPSGTVTEQSLIADAYNAMKVLEAEGYSALAEQDDKS